jgi:hypothetical protein
MSEHTTNGHGEHHHGEYRPEAQHEENVIQLTPVVIFAVVMILVSVATFMTVKIIQHTFHSRRCHPRRCSKCLPGKTSSICARKNMPLL